MIEIFYYVLDSRLVSCRFLLTPGYSNLNQFSCHLTISFLFYIATTLRKVVFPLWPIVNQNIALAALSHSLISEASNISNLRVVKAFLRLYIGFYFCCKGNKIVKIGEKVSSFKALVTVLRDIKDWWEMPSFSDSLGRLLH